MFQRGYRFFAKPLADRALLFVAEGGEIASPVALGNALTTQIGYYTIADVVTAFCYLGPEHCVFANLTETIDALCAITTLLEDIANIVGAADA
jgi:hypothetical protein